MTKQIERPTEAKHWLKLFDSLATYRHDASRLFEDYLDLVLCCMANKRREERYLEVAKRYTREELEVMAQLMGTHILIHEHQTEPIDGKRRWYDLLGDIYMDLAGRSKTSRMGQFFTPVELCSMMATMVLDGETKGRTVLDPCCGSGRMLLAAHAIAPDIGTVYAADLDGICVKMCALNFWLHGIRGEVAHMNSLSQQWYGAYHTHPRATWPFVTYLDEARKEESHLYIQRDEVFQQQEQRTANPAAAPDLFSQVSESQEEYGEPWKPCALCGKERSDTCVVLHGAIVEPWQLYGQEHELVCTGCGVALRTHYPEAVAHHEWQDHRPLYGERARAHRYLKNDERMVLDRLVDLLVVLKRHHAVPDHTGKDRWERETEEKRADEALRKASQKIALELRLRNAELVHDSIRCNIGGMMCTFRCSSLPELIRTYRNNVKYRA